MADVIVVAGTADGRQIVSELAKLNIKVAATVTSKFGSELLMEYPGVEVHEGKLTSEGMVSLIQRLHARCLVDASHPYAREASLNAAAACEKAGIPYLRFERRETATGHEGVIRVRSFEEAAEKLASFKGNILLTIGSNNLKLFTRKIPDYKKRLFVRVLPESGVVAKCEEAGLSPGNIIAMKGPFSEEMNAAMLRHCSASVMVTKDGGEAGGTMEKLAAARKLGIPVILVQRPEVSYKMKADTIGKVIEFVKQQLAAEAKE